ncbi:MAG: molybdate ABC transporter substrate-binding protein [Pseudolabrys sp.]
MAALRLLSAGAVQKMATDLAADFEREHGHKVELNFATAGMVRDRVAGGEAFDIVISSQEAIARLNTPGFFVEGSVRNLASTVTGLFVRAGAPKPDISTPEKFKQAILAARTFTYSDPAGGGTGGRLFVAVLERLGIRDEINRKTVFGKRGAEVVASVIDGRAEMGSTFISEIVPHEGAQVVGELPGDLRNTNGYAAGVPAASGERDAAFAFVKYMTAPATRPRWAAAGMTPAF